MEYKSVSIFIVETMPQEMVNEKIELAMNTLKKDEFEAFSVVGIPSRHGTIVVVAGKKAKTESP
jgi:hypothetical protein